MKPSWSKFWYEYPDYGTYRDSAAVKAAIGGEVDDKSFVNTCAIRMSQGLNYSGVTVPGKFPGLYVVRGGDEKFYALRVAEVRKWLPTAIGPPDLDVKKKAGEAFDQTAWAAFKGIIAFDISFSDATGHLDAWNGTTFSHEYGAVEYWKRAHRITLWKLA